MSMIKKYTTGGIVTNVRQVVVSAEYAGNKSVNTQ